MTIQKIETYDCTEPDPDTGKGGSCKFWVYYDQPEWTERIELWLRRFERKTWYLLDTTEPEATDDGFRISAQCVRMQWKTDTSIRTIRLRFCTDADVCTEDETTFICEPEVPTGPLPPCPVIRDISVYECDENYCGFYIFFNPPPDDVTVSVYLDDSKVDTNPPIESGGLFYVDTVYPKGKQVTVHLEFTLGIMSSRSTKVLFDPSFPEGQDTDLSSVGSSNLKGVGFKKFADLYGVKDAKDLGESAVGTLYKDEEMSEEDARARFAKMGYSSEDVDYLIILNSPPSEW